MAKRKATGGATATAEPEQPREPSLGTGEAAKELPVHPWAREFVPAMIPRSAIETAAYNPRTIDLNAQVKLKGGLEDNGLVEPLVWNRRTGRLVGGHQRLKLMDQKAGTDQYRVPVSVVDKDETEEQQLNILLNNQGAQGYWEFTKLAEMFARNKALSVEKAGFDSAYFAGEIKQLADLNKLAAEGLSLDHILKPDGSFKDDAGKDAETLKAMKASKSEYKAIAPEIARDGFYLNLVFREPKEKELFCAALDISPYAKHAEGREVAVKLGLDIGWTPPADPGSEPELDADDGDGGE